MTNPLFRLADRLYYRAFGLYRPMYLAYKAWRDREARSRLRRILMPGMTVLDIGANIGVYTRLLSTAVGQEGSVIAFEPSLENHRRLVQATRRLANVTAVHAAVGNVAGTTTLYLSDDMNVDHRTYDSGDRGRSQEVEMVRIDDWIAPGRRVDFIKIDVQGFEHQVLLGARRVLCENRGLRVFMEFWPSGLRQAGSGPRELLDLAGSLGFEVLRIDGLPFDAGELERLAFREDDGYFDCLLARNRTAAGGGIAC